MLTLSGYIAEGSQIPQGEAHDIICLSTNRSLPYPLRSSKAWLVGADEDVPQGFKAYLVLAKHAKSAEQKTSDESVIILPDTFDYLAEGDVIRFDYSRKTARVLYRKNSPNNYFLLTERCNNYCLMCSQPPKDIDDSWIINEILQTIPLIDPETREIGLTGGEPTLLGDHLIKIIQAFNGYLPQTALHILSNGRTFADEAFTAKYAATKHPDLMVGIPVYSDLSHIHDYVVQADGAFDETIRGILNLKRYNQLVEIRVVLHKQTYKRLPQLAEFITRNLAFVDHVALMGLEITGFTKANMDDLWIDPIEYKKELAQAVAILQAHRIHVSIYNLQLCTIDEKLWPIARKSISDWKNEYFDVCETCQVKDQCCGMFFSSKLRHSSHLHPIDSAFQKNI